jgi:hypothetical protein
MDDPADMARPFSDEQDPLAGIVRGAARSPSPR